jgi:phenylpyruvate tautomerase PptA (4-oxalocrotonate tautomerase family)
MPLYTVSTGLSLTVPRRKELANLIMEVHCGITGAPKTFVNVLYCENVPLADGITMNVLGTVRKGRTSAMNDTLQKELIQKISDLMKISDLQLELSLFEVPAQWVMEGGEILPEPGEEDQCEWLQKGHG